MPEGFIFIINNFWKDAGGLAGSLIFHASYVAEKVLAFGGRLLNSWAGYLILCAVCMKLGSAFGGYRLVQMSLCRLAGPDASFVYAIMHLYT